MIRNYFVRCGQWLTNAEPFWLRPMYPLGDNSRSFHLSTLEPPAAGHAGSW